MFSYSFPLSENLIKILQIASSLSLSASSASDRIFYADWTSSALESVISNGFPHHCSSLKMAICSFKERHIYLKHISWMKKPLYFLRGLPEIKPNQQIIFKLEVHVTRVCEVMKNTIQPLLIDLWDFLFEWFVPSNIGSLHIFSSLPPFFMENIWYSFIKKQELKPLNLWDVMW